MASYKAIHEVSARLKALLVDGLVPFNEFEINDGTLLLSPPIEGVNGMRLSLWLYQVVENEFLKNQPPSQTGAVDPSERYPPLVLNLFYLLTPFYGNDDGSQVKAQTCLGRAMQILHDNGRIVVDSAEPGGDRTEYSVILARRTLDELTRIWDALRQPYRLSVAYEVRVTRIESQRTRRSAPVADRQLDEAQVV